MLRQKFAFISFAKAKVKGQKLQSTSFDFVCFLVTSFLYFLLCGTAL